MTKTCNYAALAQREEPRLKVPSKMHIAVPLPSCIAERFISKQYRISPLSDAMRTAFIAVELGWNHEITSTRPCFGMRAFFASQ